MVKKIIADTGFNDTYAIGHKHTCTHSYFFYHQELKKIIPKPEYCSHREIL